VHDHRGTGGSARSRISYSVDQMTDDLVAVMDHLKIERAHLVGHSTGGAVGQTLAAKHPERLISLTIYASWTKCDPFFRRVFEARRALLTLGGAGVYTRAASVFFYPGWWINENIGLLEERVRVVVPNFPPAEIVASRINAIVAFDRTVDLPNIRLPTTRHLRQGRHPHATSFQPRACAAHPQCLADRARARRPLRVRDQHHRIQRCRARLHRPARGLVSKQNTCNRQRTLALDSAGNLVGKCDVKAQIRHILETTPIQLHHLDTTGTIERIEQLSGSAGTCVPPVSRGNKRSP
jgi:pimeloyl-ACP methyl ester carboxylesterase